MPKIVDPQQRRRAVTDAVFRIIRRSGLEQASLRNIAAEAGLSIGSVRHYFTDHAEVVGFAMAELTEQTTARILGHVEGLLNPPPGFDRRAAIEETLGEFLPLDDQRQLEVTVWFEFLAASRTQEKLRGHALKLHDGMRMIIERILTRSLQQGRLREPIDVPLETERLACLIDGLAMTMVVRGDRLSGTTARAVLHRHLDTLLLLGGGAE